MKSANDWAIDEEILGSGCPAAAPASAQSTSVFISAAFLPPTSVILLYLRPEPSRGETPISHAWLDNYTIATAEKGRPFYIEYEHRHPWIPYRD